VRTLIIGIGNPIRGDDGLGWKVAENLSRELACEPRRDDVHVLATHQLTPELAELASRADHVLFIDAAQTGDPGTMTCRRMLPDASAVRQSHALSPAALLGMTEKLYGRSPAACLLTLAGDTFSIGESFSPAVSAALPALRAKIKRLVDSESWENLVGEAGS